MIKRILIGIILIVLLNNCITINVTLEEKKTDGLPNENKEEEIIYWF